MLAQGAPLPPRRTQSRNSLAATLDPEANRSWRYRRPISERACLRIMIEAAHSFNGQLSERSSYADAQTPKHPRVIPEINRKASEHEHQNTSVNAVLHSVHVAIARVSGLPAPWKERHHICRKKTK